MIKLKPTKFKVPTNHSRHTFQVLEPHVDYLMLQKWINDSVAKVFSEDNIIKEIQNKVKVRVWED